MPKGQSKNPETDLRIKSAGKKTTHRETMKMGDQLVTLFRYTKNSLSNSPYWQARCYLDKKTRQTSTKETDLKKAKVVAKKWYVLLVSRLEEGVPSERLDRNPHLFDEVAQELLAEYKIASETGRRYKNYYKDHNNSYKNHIQPFFKKDYVENINTPRLVEWQNWRKKHRVKVKELRAGRLKKEYTTIFQVLQFAVEKGYIESVPQKPRIFTRQLSTTKKAPARATFTFTEYKKLLEVSRRRIRQAKKMVDNHEPGCWSLTYSSRRYLHYYIIFLAHTGIRPAECQRIRHKDIEMFNDENPERCHLEVFIIGKKRDRTIVSKYGAYFAYQGLCDNLCPDHKPNDLVFHTNPYNGFKALLEDSQLRYSKNGDTRDSKSFRHFYIMTALQQGIPAGQLQEQCDVSEAIIREHYGRHLQPRMFKESLIQVGHLQNP
jgi:integrase|tara:strand:+ start:125 stop:1423 length:1299 start_codon:yes stop_codon:yes gene_type:complete